MFLRKRSLKWVIFVAFCSSFTWATTVLYDYIGSQNYPCWLFMLMAYLSNCTVFVPGIMIILDYANKLSAMRLSQMLQRKSAGMDGKQTLKDFKLNPEASWDTFKGHVRTAYLGSRNEDDRIQNAKFTRSGFGYFMYGTVLFGAFLIAYFARLGMNPHWATCTGCEVATEDAILIMTLTGLAMSVAIFANSFRIQKRDALRLVREWLAAWICSSGIVIISYALYLADPNQLYANGLYNFRELLCISTLSSLYFNTVHQVIVARLIKRKLVLASTLNRLDRFNDVCRDKGLYNKLSTFLDAELSNEILAFLKAVDGYKALYDRDGTRDRAQDILATFIQFHGPLEINIGAELRVSLMVRFENDELNINSFDHAYDTIKEALLYDGFARFLQRLQEEENLRQHHGSIMIMTISSIVL